MKSLVIFEGKDGIGKSTMSQKVAAHFNAPHFRYPSAESPMGFVRDIVKSTYFAKNLTPMEVQLMHACSHIYDLVKMQNISNSEFVVCDRSIYSGLVYAATAIGHKNDTNSLKVDIITRLNMAPYREVVSKLFDNVILIGMSGERFNLPDESYHEVFIPPTDEQYEYLFNDLQSYSGSSPDHEADILKIHPCQHFISFYNKYGNFEETLSTVVNAITKLSDVKISTSITVK